MNHPITTTFGKGTYYIGDIGYVLKDSIYDHIWGDKCQYQSGTIKIKSKNGKHSKFVVDHTAYGDGGYKGSDGIIYGVDSGNIGVVPKTLWKGPSPCCNSGRVVTVKNQLRFHSLDGVFHIRFDDHSIIINTRD